MEDQTPPSFNDLSLDSSSSSDKLNEDSEHVTKPCKPPSTYIEDSTKSSNEPKSQVAKDSAILSDHQKPSISRVGYKRQSFELLSFIAIN